MLVLLENAWVESCALAQMASLLHYHDEDDADDAGADDVDDAGADDADER